MNNSNLLSSSNRTIIFKVLIFTIFILQACTQKESSKPLPIELTRDHACAVCGMITVDFQGAKAQIHYRNGKTDTFCCTLHMFSFNLQPDRPPNIAAIYVNDMGKADWEKPEGHWIDAKNAFYVVGGDVMGPHGEALVPFSGIKNAEDYKKEHGGEIIRFDDVTMDMLRPVAHSHNKAMAD
ncbi:MAG: nitrous oxide reductase accessory protein NosL [Nitrospirota bacterium]